MPEITDKEKLKQLSADDIEHAYRFGYITAAQRNDLMRRKARSNVEGLLEEEGYFKAILERTIHHVQEGWDNFTASARQPTEEATSIKGTAKNAFIAMWGEIQVLTSIFNAVGEVTGQVAENMALQAGASPGLARVINIATDVGTGFIPVGVGVRSGVKGVQAIEKKVAEKFAKKALAKAAGKEGMEAYFALAKGMAAEGIESQKISKALDVSEDLIGETVKKIKQPGYAIKTKSDWISILERHVQKAGITEVGVALEKNPQNPIEALRTSAWMIGYDEVERAAAVKLFNATKPEQLQKYLTPDNYQKLISWADDVLSKTNLSIKEKFLSDYSKFLKEMKQITETKSHEITLAEAERLGLNLDDLKNIVPGTALKESEMAAYLKALDPQVDTLIDLAKNAIKEGTDEAIEALARHTSEFFTISPKFRAAEVTAGRSVEILKETPPMKQITNMLMGWDPDMMAKGDFKGAMKTFAEDIIALTEEPAKLKALAIQQQSGWQRLKEDWWPKARSIYINLLLAKPLTQVRNIVGNSIAATNTIAERTIGGIFSLDPKTGIAGVQEGLFMAKGMRYAIGDGISALADAYKGFGADEISKLDYVPVRFTGKVSRIINLPGDTLRGVDNFFKTILTRSSYYAQAYREGIGKGFIEDELATFIARRVSHPTLNMIDTGREFALHHTFADDLGRIGKAAQKGLQTGPLTLWFPFMKTPINLAKYAWNRTPGLQLTSLLGGQFWNDIKAGGVAADLAIGRITLSSLMGMFLYDLAQEGMLTGGGPSDLNLRRAWMLRNEPYSLKMGNSWIPIAGLEPASTIPGLVADFAQIHNQLDEPTAGQTAMAITMATSRSLVDKTYWKTMGDLVDLTASLKIGEEPSQRAAKILRGPAVTVVTGGPLVSGITQAIDPIRRETRGFLDEIIARVPSYSKTLPPMRDALGDPILPPQTIGSPWLGLVSPLRAEEQTEDPIAKEINRLSIRTPIFPWNIGGRMRDDFDVKSPLPGERLPVELSPQERDQWQLKYRDLIRHPEYGIKKQLLNNPVYQEAPFALQREMFMDILAGYRTSAREIFISENADFGKRMLEADAERYAPMLNESKQIKFRGQITESLNLLDSLSTEQRENLLRSGLIEQEEFNAPIP